MKPKKVKFLHTGTKAEVKLEFIPNEIPSISKIYNDIIFDAEEMLKKELIIYTNLLITFTKIVAGFFSIILYIDLFLKTVKRNITKRQEFFKYKKIIENKLGVK